MKKLLAFLAVTGLSLTMAFAQNITLKFTGATSGGSYVRMDSVKVQNVSRSWSETLVYPDTVLTFQQNGIVEVQSSTADIASYPNPFNGTTNVAVTMPQSGNATLQVFNLAGQMVAERTMSLPAGKSLFEVRLQLAQVYLLAVTTAQGRRTVKLLNRGFGSECDILFRGNSTAEKRIATHIFQRGDELKIKGFATRSGICITSRDVQQQQTASQSFTLSFEMTVPTVITSDPSNITSSTVELGGNVVNDGGAAVTARGVCVSQGQNPTLSASHSNNGSGLGSFVYSLTGLTAGTKYYVRAYATNAFGTAYGNQITFTTTAPFSVSAGTRVLFSPGNLQWSAKNGGSTATVHIVVGGVTAAGTWRFAPNQWDTIGAGNENISSTYSGWIDLFGWGTSGFNNKNPYMTSTTYSNYGNGNTNISGTNYDWGVYNTIYNPKTQNNDAPGTWRTLTNAEWSYLINTRTTTSGIRYAKAKVNGVPGLILVPDGWRSSTYTLNSTNTTSAAYTANVISAAQWTTLENAGAIFLPTAGDRSGSTVGFGVGNYGRYWSATYSNSSYAYCMAFGSGSMGTDTEYRNYGISVRLVRNAQ
ncbi:MAG: T9SS type A sorting domain-containing protein [Bacteroidales bacterium]|nr:T9SS type A sorting domain-containing protein [Bacteroidales bacterium]